MSGSVRCRTMDWKRLAQIQWHNLVNAISMAIYVRGTYRQTQQFNWLIIGRFTTTCFGPIPGPSSGCITT